MQNNYSMFTNDKNINQQNENSVIKSKICQHILLIDI